MDTREIKSKFNRGGTLENQLFEWGGWEDLGTMMLQFLNVTLKVPIGEFPAGTKFAYAILVGDSSLLQLSEDEDGKKIHEFELKLSVGERINTD